MLTFHTLKDRISPNIDKISSNVIMMDETAESTHNGLPLTDAGHVNISRNITETTTDSLSIDNLYPAIFQCFAIILAGYIAGRADLVNGQQAKGISAFVSKFCLPALLFRSMVSLDFHKVNWHFVLGIAISKTIVFMAVMVVTLLVRRPVHLGYAGLFAIFATQSNDFAVGYPVLEALYGDTNKEYLQYIYLVAPISLVMLNPIGFTLLEIHRQKQESMTSSTKRGNCILVLKVTKEVLTNPIVFMVIIGIIGNFVFKQKVPGIIDDVLEVLGNAFSASALFYLGLSLVGKVKGQLGIGLVVPLLLIAAKTLLLPLITWQVVGALEPSSPNSSHSLSMYGFLYGTFPTAPSVFIYASQFGVAQDIIATGMVVCTFLSAPLMFVSAKMMTVVVYSEMDYKSLLVDTSFDISVISLCLNVWILAVLFLSKKHKKVPHQFLIVLVFTQSMACIGMIIYDGLDKKLAWNHYIQFVTSLVGVLSTRCLTAVLSVVLYLVHCRSLCFVLRIKAWLYFFGIGFPVLGTGALLLLGTHHLQNEIDPSFHYGVDQAVLSLIILSVCTSVNIVFLVLRQRNSRYNKDRKTKPNQSRLQTNTNASAKVIIEEEKDDDDDDDDLITENLIQDEKEARPRTSSTTSLLGNMEEGAEDETRRYKSTSCRDCTEDCEVNLYDHKGPKRASSIEDIVPFPRRNINRSQSSLSSSSTASLTDTLQEQSCRSGKCDYQQRQKCAGLLRCYHSLTTRDHGQEDSEVQIKVPKVKDEYQTERFIVLLLVLQLSMFMGLFLCTWRLFNNKTTGIYVEIEFLDSVFNYGQSLIVFALFGFDTRLMIIPCIRRYFRCIVFMGACLDKRWRKWVYGTETVHIPPHSDLSEDTKHTCEQFVKYHKENCCQDIVKDRKYRFRKYNKVFCGTSLCDWLIEVGLARDRQEAVSYGRTLLIGQVIGHVTKEHDFHDMPYFYRFLNDEEKD